MTARLARARSRILRNRRAASGAIRQASSPSARAGSRAPSCRLCSSRSAECTRGPSHRTARENAFESPEGAHVDLISRDLRAISRLRGERFERLARRTSVVGVGAREGGGLEETGACEPHLRMVASEMHTTWGGSAREVDRRGISAASRVYLGTSSESSGQIARAPTVTPTSPLPFRSSFTQPRACHVE